MSISIDMVLHCPRCGLQHIDAPGAGFDGKDGPDYDHHWDNPPHRSHLCVSCGHIWRPADVPTNGVAAVKTVGKNDSPPAPPLRWVASHLLSKLESFVASDGDSSYLSHEEKEAEAHIVAARAAIQGAHAIGLGLEPTTTGITIYCDNPRQC